jgi:hypothetical protein
MILATFSWLLRTVSSALPFGTSVVPLDYAGMAAALGGRFDTAAKIKDWYQYRPEASSALTALRRWARDPEGGVPCEFSENSYKESLIGDSAKLALYRYRRGGAGRQPLAKSSCNGPVPSTSSL